MTEFYQASITSKVVHLSDDGKVTRCGRRFEYPYTDNTFYDSDKLCAKCGTKQEFEAVRAVNEQSQAKLQEERAQQAQRNQEIGERRRELVKNDIQPRLLNLLRHMGCFEGHIPDRHYDPVTGVIEFDGLKFHIEIKVKW